MMTMADPGDHPANVAPQRELGYLQALSDAGLADRARVFRCPQSGPQRDDMFRHVLTAPDRPRAVFCWSDLDAIP